MGQGLGFMVLDQRDIFTIGITEVDIRFLGYYKYTYYYSHFWKYDGNKYRTQKTLTHKL